MATKDKTSLEVGRGSEHLSRVVTEGKVSWDINAVFRCLRLVPGMLYNPVHHISLASCYGSQPIEVPSLSNQHKLTSKTFASTPAELSHRKSESAGKQLPHYSFMNVGGFFFRSKPQRENFVFYELYEKTVSSIFCVCGLGRKAPLITSSDKFNKMIAVILRQGWKQGVVRRCRGTQFRESLLRPVRGRLEGEENDKWFMQKAKIIVRKSNCKLWLYFKIFISI